MYFTKITLENIGPIENFEFMAQFSDEGNPKPVIIVGENGSGKSIFLSHIVNGMLAALSRIHRPILLGFYAEAVILLFTGFIESQVFTAKVGVGR